RRCPAESLRGGLLRRRWPRGPAPEQDRHRGQARPHAYWTDGHRHRAAEPVAEPVDRPGASPGGPPATGARSEAPPPHPSQPRGEGAAARGEETRRTAQERAPAAGLVVIRGAHWNEEPRGSGRSGNRPWRSAASCAASEMCGPVEPTDPAFREILARGPRRTRGRRADAGWFDSA